MILGPKLGWRDIVLRWAPIIFVASLYIVACIAIPHMDAATWAPKDENIDRIASPTFFWLMLGFFFMGLILHLISVRKKIFAPEVTPSKTAKNLFNTEAGVLGIYLFVSSLFVMLIDAHAGTWMSHSEERPVTHRVEFSHGQPNVEPAPDLQGLVGPRYFVYVEKIHIRIPVCKKVYEEIQGGRTTIDVIEGISFGYPFIRSNCN